MSNNKNQKKENSTIENLSKELKDRIVNVGTGNPFSGTINHTNVNSDFSPFNRNALTKEQIEKEDISISVNYGTSGGSIKSQLKAQGFKFKKELIKECEAVRLDLLSLLNIDILTAKQGQKAFARLNTMISNNVIEMTFGDVETKIKKTFVNDKEVK